MSATPLPKITDRVAGRWAYASLTIAGAASLTWEAGSKVARGNFLTLDVGNASRNVTLPPESQSQGVMLIVKGKGAAGGVAVMKAYTGGATVASVNYNQQGVFVCDGTAWTCLGVFDLTGNPIGNLTGNADTATKLLVSSVFKSAEQTGTGAPQNVAHGLGVTPGAVWWSLSGGHDGAGGAGDKVPTVAPGAHGTTNCVFTVTAGAKFFVFAMK